MQYSSHRAWVTGGVVMHVRQPMYLSFILTAEQASIYSGLEAGVEVHGPLTNCDPAGRAVSSTD